MGNLSVTLFPAGEHSNLLVERITLTTGNPNDAGILTLLFMSWFVSKLFITPSLVYLIFILVLSIVLFFTASRTDFVAFLVGLTFLTLFSVLGRRSILSLAKTLLFIVVLMVLFLYFGYEKVPYIHTGLLTFFAGENTSVLKRFDIWTQVLHYWVKSPWIGWGPAKSIHSTIVDGDYFLILGRYGIMGIIVFYFPLVCFLLFFAVRLVKRFYVLTSYERSVIVSTLFVILMIFVVSITNVFMSSYLFVWQFLVLVKVSYLILYRNVRENGYEKSLSHFNGSSCV